MERNEKRKREESGKINFSGATFNNNAGSNNYIGNANIEINNNQNPNQKRSVSQNDNNSQIISKNLTKGELIGQGGFGKVYLGYYNNRQVAIKELPFNIKGIDKEINILKSLRNPNIIGYYDEFQKDNNVYIVMEYAEQGSLNRWIERNKNNPHDWQFNFNFIKQAVNGLDYLHNQGVIHRDIKSHNVLIAENNILKLADFGLAKIIDEATSTGQNPKGTWRWLAPEVLEGSKHSCQSDIYSLGMVIWEICSKNTLPFSQLDNNQAVMFNVVFSGLREVIPNDTPAKIKEIIADCWEKEPSQRISLTEIENKLNNSEKIIEVLDIKTLSNHTQSSSSSSQTIINQLQLQFQIRDKKDDLKLIISELKTKLRSKSSFANDRQKREEKLNTLFADLPNNPQQFVNYLEAIKTDLGKKITQEEINNLYQIKKEITELNNQYSLQAQILVDSK